MCLTLEKKWKEETEKLKKSNNKIIGYKIISRRYSSMFCHYRWTKGLNISNRESADLTEEELQLNEIRKGFHFFTNKPKNCKQECENINNCSVAFSPANYVICKCTSKKKLLNNVIKFEIDPKDLVAVGKWEKEEPCFVATKCTWIKEV